LIAIRITIRIQEFFIGIFTIAERNSSMNFAGSAVLAEVFGIRLVLVIIIHVVIMTPPLGWSIKQWCCLMSVWRLYVAYTGPISREQRGLYKKIKIGKEVAHVTRDSDITFKVKRSKVKVTGRGAYCGGFLTACYCINCALRARCLSVIEDILHNANLTCYSSTDNVNNAGRFCATRP